MNPTSFVPAIVATLCATFVAFLLSRRYPAAARAHRCAPIDGLRGYLALFVFLQHASLWYFYVRDGRWQPLPSQWYTHFGPCSVALFFMITGFLFYSKLISARDGSFDWERLYIARVLRLAPLYLFAITVMLLIVIATSGAVLHTSLGQTALDLLRWITFTIPGRPDINGLKIANVAMAGVVWTLPYEWFFYLALPVLALTVGIRPSWPYLLLGLLAVAAALVRLEANIFLMFAGGIAAAVLVRYRRFCEFATSGIAAIIAIISIWAAVALFPIAFGFAPFVLLAVFFCIVAAGNDLFGLLTRPAARKLGEMAYSIYMLHGLILFATFRLILGATRSRALSPLGHWATIIFGVIPAMLLICHTTFRYIESPPMQRTRDLKNWLKSRTPLGLSGAAS